VHIGGGAGATVRQRLIVTTHGVTDDLSPYWCPQRLELEPWQRLTTASFPSQHCRGAAAASVCRVDPCTDASVMQLQEAVLVGSVSALF
jgi:hypothetical protein